MHLYRPSKLHTLKIKAKKTLSQNFLIDQNILEKICAAAKVSANDHILEIGPGPGALTEKLLEKGANVHAIEKDQTLAEKLHTSLTSERLKITCDDALHFPLKNLPDHTKIVANLPYHITTPIIIKFLTQYPKIASLTVMVQKEVGERMTAKVDTKEYSNFTLLLQAFSKPKYCFTVKPNSFFPVPSVHSCVIHLPLHNFPFSFSQEDFFTMTRKAFGQRRKMLKTSLKELYDPALIEKICKKARPQELSLEDFAILFQQCEKNGKRQNPK